jgi:hypothetical protein
LEQIDLEDQGLSTANIGMIASMVNERSLEFPR